MARTGPCCDNSLGRMPMSVPPSTPRPALPMSIAFFAWLRSALASPHLPGLALPCLASNGNSPILIEGSPQRLMGPYLSALGLKTSNFRQHHDAATIRLETGPCDLMS